MNKHSQTGRHASAAALTRIAVCAVLLAVCSWISIPFAVPFTLQTLGVFLALRLLGGKQGTAAILLYLLLGAAGLPVFAGFGAGPGVLFGPTGGFLWGFLLTGLLYLIGEALLSRRTGLTPAAVRKRKTFLLAVGLLLCYLCGTVMFCYVAGTGGKTTGFGAALLVCVVPYILPDALKLWLSAILEKRISRHI